MVLRGVAWGLRTPTGVSRRDFEVRGVGACRFYGVQNGSKVQSQGVQSFQDSDGSVTQNILTLPFG